MNRIRWSAGQRQEFFGQLERCGRSWREVARLVGVHPRTPLSWRRGASKVPSQKLQQLAIIGGVTIRNRYELVSDKSERLIAARLGGLARLQKYGPPGTLAGCRKGGLRAAKTHRASSDTRINYPPMAEELAEFIGLMTGDGNIYGYQVKVYGCESTDSEYKYYVLKLAHSLFGLNGSVSFREDCWTISFSSIGLVRLLHKLDLPVGDKIKHEIDIPLRLKNSTKLIIAYLRGLFDTDGSVYLDRHRINNKNYQYIGIIFTSYSPRLLESIYIALKKIGFSPIITPAHHNVFLHRQSEIRRFFDQIKPANAKHQERYKLFIRRDAGAVEQAGLENQ